MRRYMLTIAVVLALLAGYFAKTPEAQDFRGYARVFAAQSGTGNTASSGALRSSVNFHTIHLVVTGAPAACTYRLQGSANGSVWFNISAADITCTSSITTFEGTAKPTRYIRGNLLTLSGGTAPTVTMHYVGMN